VFLAILAYFWARLTKPFIYTAVMGIFVSTTGTDVAIAELGITIVHPTTDMDLLAQFSSLELKGADSLTSAITSGTLVWKKTSGGAAQLPAGYDPDYGLIYDESTGTGNSADRLATAGDVAAVTAASLGLGNLDNTSDLNKPISTATQTALNAKVTANTAITGATKTKITFDSKGLVTAGADMALGDNTDVVLTSPVLSDVLKYNGSQWVNGQITSTTGAGSGINYFLTATLDSGTGYDVMQKTPDSAAEVDESIAVTSATSPLLFEPYISAVEVGHTSIEGGIWNFNIYNYVSAASGTTYMTLHVYKRTAGGTETQLFQVDLPTITHTAVAIQNIETVQPSFACNATDKLVFKFYVTTSSGSSITVHLVHSGSAHYSYISTPLLLQHDDLAGLQGGTTSQYYHLTNTEYTGTGSGVFVRSTAPNITSPTGIVKADVGLNLVDNTSDLSKPISTATQTALNGKQPLDTTLTALAAFNSNGILVQTAADTFTSRSVVAGSTKIAISNADGVAGNPSIDVTEANLTLNNIGGTLGISKGGTGQITQQLAINALAGAVTTAQFLRGNGTNVVMSGIQVADVPTLNQNTTGTASNVTGTVAIANGGTGQTTQQLALNALAGTVITSKYLRGNGTNVLMDAIPSTDLPTISLTGDATGSASGGSIATTVEKLQGRTLASTTPNHSQSIVWNGTSSQWEPSTGLNVVTTSGATQTLTNNSSHSNLYKGTTAGQIVNLPAANTLATTDEWEFINASDVAIPIKDNSGAFVYMLLPTESVELVPYDLSTAAGKWLVKSHSNNAKAIIMHEDFFTTLATTGNIGQLGWALTGTGAAVAYQASAAERIGVLQFSCGTANNASISMNLGVNNIVPGRGPIVFETYVMFPSLGGTGAAAFTGWLGLIDTTNANDATNGYYFEYAGTAGGTINWNCKTAAASTRTSTGSGIALVANQWYKLTLCVSEGNSQCAFYIDGVFITTTTTNLPTAVLGQNFRIVAGATNAAAKSAQVDYAKIILGKTLLR
jgi:hypothetical protein